MVSTIYTAGLAGIEGFEVTVECSVRNRVPRFDMVGLGDTAVKEAKERVRAAMENCGIFFPHADVMVNLAPADRKKEGSAFDLAILLSILQGAKLLPKEFSSADKSFFGELSLSGDIRPTRGILCLTLAAKEAGRTTVFVPITVWTGGLPHRQCLTLFLTQVPRAVQPSLNSLSRILPTKMR